MPGDTRPPMPAELVRLRASIDNLDAALVHLLAERFRCTQQVGVLKATVGLPPSDPAREEQQMARLRQLAQEAGLDPVSYTHLRAHETVLDIVCRLLLEKTNQPRSISNCKILNKPNIISAHTVYINRAEKTNVNK